MKMAMDDGSGILKLVQRLESKISDAQLRAVQLEFPEAEVGDKVTCYMFLIWQRLFGNAAGARKSQLFREYPVLGDSWSDAGGTGEDDFDMALLKKERACC